ncbi:ankyrin repeat-containing domain protein, partial [Trichophaea hybrida]
TEDRPSALLVAVSSGSLAEVKLLIEEAISLDLEVRGQTVNGSWVGLTPLQRAVKCHDCKILQFLTRASANVNAPACGFAGATALQLAVHFVDMALVDVPLSNGADINAPASGSIGATALQIAVRQQDMEMVDRLLQAGADVNGESGRVLMRTVVQHATSNEDIDIAEKLLKAGARPDALILAADLNSSTALQKAALKRHLEVVKTLLRCRANVNAPAPEPSYETALQAAARCGQKEIVEMLLGAGADVHAAPAEDGGKSAISFQWESGYCGEISSTYTECKVTVMDLKSTGFNPDPSTTELKYLMRCTPLF